MVVYPPRFTKEKKYPLVLVVHGGPQAASGTSFSFLPQVLAACDYVVFEPNQRGSDNLGNAYQRAVFNDAGAGPGRDVMAGVEALQKLGFVDSSRIAVSGWSYGGYMTSWLIGHYHIWKAALSGDGEGSSDGSCHRILATSPSPTSDSRAMDTARERIGNEKSASREVTAGQCQSCVTAYAFTYLDAASRADQ